MSDKKDFKSVFDPRLIGGQQYKVFYPELMRIDEFKGVSNRMLMVAWYYSCECSPLIKNGISNNDRISKALELGDKDRKLSKGIWYSFQKLDFTDEFVRACKRFASISYNARSEGLDMLSNFMSSFSDISKLKPKDFKMANGEIDYEKYARTASTITSQLPNLIKMTEEGFGVSKSADIIEEESLISRFHELNR